jgi:hypothetical protein
MPVTFISMQKSSISILKPALKQDTGKIDKGLLNNS